MTKTKLIPLEELYEKNTIGVKLIEQIRSYQTALAGEKIEKKIIWMKYLKVYCQCESSYETFKYNSYTCCNRCRQNISFRRRRGLNFLENTEGVVKGRMKEFKDKFGYL
ncbi:MAG TPA: hypothetical protein DEA97_18120 [Bacteroidales bacterium]|nr:MAG: hypothetical protein UR43_C0009G0001 [candidate division TM6 bacterium GW2011_GWF2_33_332]OFY79217.1 MAG: hypothetical protein A2281_14735 [Bacteroidetes bacterium RIFOXYA12_FULL_38_20]HBS88481.1 hypothetical protein [Bacteroidales bacterium]